MCRYLKNRISILGCIRVLMLAFLAFVVPYIVKSHPGASTRWMDMSGLGPLVVVPLGLLVSLLCLFCAVLGRLIDCYARFASFTWSAVVVLRESTCAWQTSCISKCEVADHALAGIEWSLNSFLQVCNKRHCDSTSQCALRVLLRCFSRTLWSAMTAGFVSPCMSVSVGAI